MKKYEYLTGEDLRHRPSALKKTKFEYSQLALSFSEEFEKDKTNSGAKSESDFNYDSNHKFYEFCKMYGEFKDMSLRSKYNKINDFNKRKPKNATQKGANYEKSRRALRKVLRCLQK